MITMIAIAMLAACALLLNNPLLLEWHNAAAVFHDPVTTHVGLALITHQLGYFDILPLYVVLMLMAPFIAIVDRYAPHMVLPLSLLLYVVTLTFQISIPTWPVEGQWFFNPLAWQLVFVLGFVLAREDGLGGFVRRHIVAIRWLSVPIVLAALALVLTGWWWDPTKVPQPRLFFLVDKTFMTPMRVDPVPGAGGGHVGNLSVHRPGLERPGGFPVHAWQEFALCVLRGSILSLAGQIIRYIYQGNFFIDTAVVICGIAIMALAAWLPEWRDQVRARRSVTLAPSS